MHQRLLDTWNSMLDSTIDHAPYVLVGLVALLLFSLAGSATAKMAIRLGTNTRLDATVALLLARLAQAGFIFIGLLTAAVIMLPNFKVADALAGLGIASIAVGFALKEILQNFFAGTLILWRKPFLIGDEIRSRNFEGTVEDINFRATQLRTFSGTRAVIPNSEIFANSLEVMTANLNRRVELIVGIGYQDSPEIAKRLVSNVLENMPRISTSRVYVTELAPSSVNLKIHFWTEAQQAKVLEVTDEVLTAIKQVLDEAGIDIPYPHNVVLLHNATRSRPNDTSRRSEPKWHDMDARDSSK